MIPLSWYLVVAAGLFCIGLYGALAPERLTGQVFAIMVIALAAAEAAVGLALIIAIYRSRDTINVEEIDMMKW